MDIFTALHSRRSIRSYAEGAVSDDEVKILLDAAMIAPSAGNARPWQFIVIDDKSLLARVPAINQYAGMAPKAPLGIVVCGDLSLEKYPGFWVQDCSAAIQNMLLAATGLGLGSVWTGIYPMPDRVSGFQRLLALPESVIPLGLVVLGRHEGSFERMSRFEEHKIHHNFYSKKA